jgi:hypothetical protein
MNSSVSPEEAIQLRLEHLPAFSGLDGVNPPLANVFKKRRFRNAKVGTGFLGRKDVIVSNDLANRCHINRNLWV